MSKFIQLTCKGDPRLINVEKIVLVDKAKDGSAQVYLNDSEDAGYWLVDQYYDEVVKAIASNAYVYDAVAKGDSELEDVLQVDPVLSRMIIGNRTPLHRF